MHLKTLPRDFFIVIRKRVSRLVAATLRQPGMSEMDARGVCIAVICSGELGKRSRHTRFGQHYSVACELGPDRIPCTFGLCVGLDFDGQPMLDPQGLKRVVFVESLTIEG